MPRLHKIDANTAETWENEPLPTPVNPRGITRMDYPHHGSVGWMARVYANGATFTRYFADETHGGPTQALRNAESWRDEQRTRVAASERQSRTGTWRMARTDNPQNNLVGWYAYVWPQSRQRIRRYFSDSAHGGSEAALQAAEQWAKQQLGN